MSRPVAAALAIVLVGAIAGAAVLARVAPVSATNERGERVLFRADTQYHRITVTEADNIRHLRFDATNQSAIDLTDGYRSTIAYPNYFDLALAIKPDAKRVLVLGMGGGAVTKRWWRDYPDMTIDSVEIDPVVVDVASRYFGLPEDARLGVFTTDARRYIQTTDKTYDVVIVDAYYADSLPFHLTTSEFLERSEVAHGPRRRAGLQRHQPRRRRRTASSSAPPTGPRAAVWDHLWAFPIGLSEDGDAEKRRNIIVLASDADITASELLRRIVDRGRRPGEAGRLLGVLGRPLHGHRASRRRPGHDRRLRPHGLPHRRPVAPRRRACRGGRSDLRPAAAASDRPDGMPDALSGWCCKATTCRNARNRIHSSQ